MIVVGGTYHERSLDPASHELWGSGLRAARLLEALGASPLLVTCIDDASQRELEAVSALHRVGVDARPRDRAICYSYATPVQPAVREGNATADPISVTSNVVLGFGMAETTWSATASLAVIDPQHSPVDEILAATAADRRALVLNEHEARRMTGALDPEEAARALLAMDVEVVVIKCGARGGLVVTEDESSWFGVVPTAHVGPIGSGDAFTAGFTYAWAIENKEPRDAAAFASRVAAAHSLVGASAFSASVLNRVDAPVVFRSDSDARVYLAAPFFDVGQRAVVRVARDALQHLGVGVFSPLDEIGAGGDEVAAQDLEGLAGAGSLLAMLDGADPGTLFEAGWATHAGIPVIGCAEDPDDHAWTMLRGTGAIVVQDLSTAIYQAAWKALENAEAPR